MMSVDEVRLRLRRKLEEAYGVEEANLLLDHTLDLKLEALEHRLRAEITGVRGELHKEIGGVRTEMANLASELRGEMREQTWRLTGALLASMALIAAILRIG
jgi:hypothetical protein